MPAAAPFPRPTGALLAVAAALLAAAPCPATLAAARAGEPAKIQQSAEELARVRARLEAANQALAHDRGEQDEQRAAVEAAERKIVATQASVRAAGSKVSDVQARVREAEAARAAAEQRLATTRLRLSQQIRAAYVADGAATDLLFGAEPPDRKARLMSYFDALNRASATQIASIESEQQALAERQAALDAQLAELKDAEAVRRRALAQLEADRAARSQALAALDQRIGSRASEIKQLSANEAQLENLLKELKRSAAASPAPRRGEGSKPSERLPPEMRGKHPWPLRGPILANYGEAKADSRLQWRGLWIAAPEGAEVRATARGRVAYVGWLSSYGLIVVLEHDDGYFSLYGHNASVSKLAGESVDAGEVISFAGNTGGYEKSGLYFEIRKGTEPLNPRDWLAR